MKNVKGNTSDSQDNPHIGHRQRLKNKVRKADLEILSPHEMIELLLTYTIPYKDTNPLAHEMLKIYGSIDKCIDANYTDLQKIKGIGEETALFFKVLSNLFDIYKKSKDSNNNYTISNTADGVRYFRKHYSIKLVETFIIFGLSKTRRIVCSCEVKGADDTSINIDMKRLTDILSMENVYSIFVVHTHPNGDPKPSQEDILATEKIYNACIALNVSLDDHVIISEDSHYSFGREGLLYNIIEKFKTHTDVIQLKTKVKIPVNKD
ncbi:MAG: RadC family protein [Clostridia bacterium]|nr:RadC family protein [Clostridia bacterium]